MENVRFDNWAMEDVGQAINVTNYYLMEGEVRGRTAPVSPRTPVFRNIAIGNMTISRARAAIESKACRRCLSKGCGSTTSWRRARPA